MIGVVRETQSYVRNLERGLTLFDLPAADVAKDLAQWQPILDWIRPVMLPPPAAEPVNRRAVGAMGAMGSSLAPPLKAAQHTLAAGSRLGSVLTGGRPLNLGQRPEPVITSRPQSTGVQQQAELLKS
jgi:chromosome partitioning protein